jgi:hypothetical protein
MNRAIKGSFGTLVPVFDRRLLQERDHIRAVAASAARKIDLGQIFLDQARAQTKDL